VYKCVNAVVAEAHILKALCRGSLVYYTMQSHVTFRVFVIFVYIFCMKLFQPFLSENYTTVKVFK